MVVPAPEELVHRVDPAPDGHPFRQPDQCLDAARQAIQGHDRRRCEGLRQEPDGLDQGDVPRRGDLGEQGESDGDGGGVGPVPDQQAAGLPDPGRRCPQRDCLEAFVAPIREREIAQFPDQPKRRSAVVREVGGKDLGGPGGPGLGVVRKPRPAARTPLAFGKRFPRHGREACPASGGEAAARAGTA